MTSFALNANYVKAEIGGLARCMRSNGTINC
jgi:hypothetical protein